MKKRTLLVGSLLLASLSNAKEATNSEAYLEANTGTNQKSANELCLKVETMSIASMGPNGFVSSIIGLSVSDKTPARDLVIEPNFDTKECETGYIKISTTAPLRSLRNAPIGL